MSCSGRAGGRSTRGTCKDATEHRGQCASGGVQLQVRRHPRGRACAGCAVLQPDALAGCMMCRAGRCHAAGVVRRAASPRALSCHGQPCAEGSNDEPAVTKLCRTLSGCAQGRSQLVKACAPRAHPVFSILARRITAAVHTCGCPHGQAVHSQVTRFAEPRLTALGLRSPFSWGCHCLARSGRPSATLDRPAASPCEAAGTAVSGAARLWEHDQECMPSWQQG